MVWFQAQVSKKEEEMKALNKKHSSLDKEYQRLKTQMKMDSEAHEKDLETMESKLNDSRRNVESTKRKLETAEKSLSRTNQAQWYKFKNLFMNSSKNNLIIWAVQIDLKMKMKIFSWIQ